MVHAHALERTVLREKISYDGTYGENQRRTCVGKPPHCERHAGTADAAFADMWRGLV